jgi:hypothetical protein
MNSTLDTGAKPARDFNDYITRFDEFISTTLPDAKKVMVELHDGIRADTVWRKGVEPIPFDVFVKTVSGSDLTARQLQAFQKSNMLRAADIVAPTRPLQEIILMYGKGCLSGDTELTDRSALGVTRTMREWCELGQSIRVRTRKGGKYRTAFTTPVVCLGREMLYQVCLENGAEFQATAEHKCMEADGWITVGEMIPGVTRIETSSGWICVESVAEIGEDDFYDLTVPSTGCYYDDLGTLHSNSGKDWLAALFIAYLALLVCELTGDPAVFFGMAAFSQMSVLNVAPSEDLARQVFFRYLTQNVKHRIFDEYAPTILADEVRFNRLNPDDGKPYQFLCLYSKHSKSSGLDGYNLLGWVMDEADAFLDSADKSNADIVHNILRSSCNTRLKNRWVGLVISYPRVEGGFMMRLYDRAKKEMAALGSKASFYADRAATWEVRPDVSREDPGIRADYDNDPISAAALYETIPANTIDAFFEFAERIDAAVKHDREPVAYVTSDHPLDMPSGNGKQGSYITAILGRVNPVPGHSYFLGVDTGLVSDATAISIFHTNDTVDAISYLCPACGTPENRQFATYVQQPTLTCVPYSAEVFCGQCYQTNFDWFQIAPVPNAVMRLDLWWVRGDVSGASDPAAVIKNGQGQAFDIPHVYEDLLVQIKPFRASRPGEVNRPVYFPGIQSLCQELIQKLNVRQTRLDPWNTAQITQNLIESTGGDIDKISFSAPDQYRRARLVKAMLYADKITLLPNEARDREWKRLQRVSGNTVNHPKGVGESKDFYDAESVAIWCAATSKCSQLEASWI